MAPRRLPAALLVVALALGACASDPTPPATSSAEPSADPEPSMSASTAASPSPSDVATSCDAPVRVALVTDIGGIDDNGYGQAAYEGMTAAAAAAPTCFETTSAEIANESEYATHIATFTADGNDVVIGVGLLAGDALGDAATKSPDTRFIAVDSVPTTGHDGTWTTNGLSLFFAEDQAGYLAGVLAASLSEANRIGVVGTLVTVPPVERYVEGYVNGAKATRDSITVDTVYTNATGDLQLGRNAATHLIAQGADVIFAAGGLTGRGDPTANGALVQACTSDALAIGADTDQYLTLEAARPCLVSSAMKNIAGAVRDALLEIARGSFTPGIHVSDASTGGIALAPFHDHEALVTDEVRVRLEEALAGLADGSIDTDVTINGG